MSISTFFGLQTALSGILAQQRGMDVTAHNVSNANTVGYTRQEAILTASPAFSYPSIANSGIPGQIGTGVDVTGYRRLRDQFVDVQLRAQSTRQGNYQAKSDGLDQVELALNEPGDNGINSLLDKYWNAWQDVANAPENMATRQSLVQAAGALTDGFQTLSSQLTTIQSQTAANVTDTIGQVNTIGKQILDLNLQIANSTAVGDTPNDLLDKRDVLVDQLAQLGNVSTTAGTNGAIDVSFAGASARHRRHLVGHARRERPHEPLVRQARRPRQPPRHGAAGLQEPARRDRERDGSQDERAPSHRLRPQRHPGLRLLHELRHDRRDHLRRPGDRGVARQDRGREGARRGRRRDDRARDRRT